MGGCMRTDMVSSQRPSGVCAEKYWYTTSRAGSPAAAYRRQLGTVRDGETRLAAELAAPVLGVLDVAGDRSEHGVHAVDQVGVPWEVEVHDQTRLAPRRAKLCQ